MRLLIDGYNLLNGVGFVNFHRPNSLEQSRRLLLKQIAEALPPDDLSHTTVVFDARNAPPGLPSILEFRGITIRFAPRSQEADDLLEELIQQNHTPRRLVVVSSDHRVQRMARRRRARAVDSDVWYSEILRNKRRIEEPAEPPDDEKPSPTADESWPEFFLADDDSTPEPPSEFENPFPEGYGDDLLKGE